MCCIISEKVLRRSSWLDRVGEELFDEGTLLTRGVLTMDASCWVGIGNVCHTADAMVLNKLLEHEPPFRSFAVRLYVSLRRPGHKY